MESLVIIVWVYEQFTQFPSTGNSKHIAEYDEISKIWNAPFPRQVFTLVIAQNKVQACKCKILKYFPNDIKQNRWNDAVFWHRNQLLQVSNSHSFPEYICQESVDVS